MRSCCGRGCVIAKSLVLSTIRQFHTYIFITRDIHQGPTMTPTSHPGGMQQPRSCSSRVNTTVHTWTRPSGFHNSPRRRWPRCSIHFHVPVGRTARLNVDRLAAGRVVPVVILIVWANPWTARPAALQPDEHTLHHVLCHVPVRAAFVGVQRPLSSQASAVRLTGKRLRIIDCLCTMLTGQWQPSPRPAWSSAAVVLSPAS